MYVSYDDILTRIDELPKWWSNGVPRYDEFNPDAIDVYACCAALVHTKCCCGTDYYQGVVPRDRESFKNGIMVGEAGMGDPPNACHILSGRECGSASDSCREIRVVEFWEKVSFDEYVKSGIRWRRLPEYEVQLTDHFVSSPQWEPVELTPEQFSSVQLAHANGGKIAAVKVVMELTNVSLGSAKFWVDNNFS